MPGARQHILINASIETVYAVITDFRAYPELFTEVQAAKVIDAWEGGCEVAFRAQIVRDVHYTLAFTLEPPTHMAWKFVRGQVMKSNTGSWALVAKGKQTEATYEIDVGLGPLVPKMITKTLVENSLPKLLQAVKARAEKQSTDKG